MSGNMLRAGEEPVSLGCLEPGCVYPSAQAGYCRWHLWLRLGRDSEDSEIDRAREAEVHRGKPARMREGR